MLFNSKQLEALNDAIYISYMTYGIEDKTVDYVKVRKFLKTNKKVVATAALFILISKLTNKHPQKLYPKYE